MMSAAQSDLRPAGKVWCKPQQMQDTHLVEASSDVSVFILEGGGGPPAPGGSYPMRIIAYALLLAYSHRCCKAPAHLRPSARHEYAAVQFLAPQDSGAPRLIQVCAQSAAAGMHASAQVLNFSACRPSYMIWRLAHALVISEAGADLHQL